MFGGLVGDVRRALDLTPLRLNYERLSATKSAQKMESLLNDLYYAIYEIDKTHAGIFAVYIAEYINEGEYAAIPKTTDHGLVQKDYELSDEGLETMIPLVERAKKRWAHDLKVHNLNDISMWWESPSSTTPSTQLLEPEEQSLLKKAWDERYAAEPYNSETKCAGLSILWTDQSLEHFIAHTPNLRVSFTVSTEPRLHPEFLCAPPPAPSPFLLQARREEERLRRINSHLQARLSAYPFTSLRKNGLMEPWYPFPAKGHAWAPKAAACVPHRVREVQTRSGWNSGWVQEVVEAESSSAQRKWMRKESSDSGEGSSGSGSGVENVVRTEVVFDEEDWEDAVFSDEE